MTVSELSGVYRRSGEILTERILQLRRQEAREKDPEAAYGLWRRRMVLEGIRRDDCEIANHLARYGKGEKA